MKARIEAWRSDWQTRPPRERLIIAATAAAVGLALLALFWSWLQGEEARLQKAVPLAQARLQRMQDDAAEVVRLRAQSGASTQATSPADAVAASLKSHQLDLTLTADGDRMQLHGSADFDQTMNWLASAQQDFKLRLASFSAKRAGGGVSIDAVLVSATPANP
jgi:type II secretory pathway component PulM